MLGFGSENAPFSGPKNEFGKFKWVCKWCKRLRQTNLNKQIQQLKIKKVMEKEIKYVAPQAEVLSAEIEKGFQGSMGGLEEGPDVW